RGDWGWVHVNLIPLNPTPGSRWTASDPADEREFVRRLEARGIPTTVRDTGGREVTGIENDISGRRELSSVCQLVLGEQVSGLVCGVDQVDVGRHRATPG